MESLCRKLKPIIGSKADELWYRWLASDWEEKRELESDIQIIAEKALKDNPLEDRKILLPPPTEEQAKGDFILGNVIYKDRKLFPLYLREEDFIKQIGIYSVTGAGKTNAAMLMSLELLKKGIPFMIIDWKRQYRSMLSLKDFPNMEKVEIYTIGRDVLPFLWNPFRPPPGVDHRTWLSVIIECLEKSHLSGPGVGDFFIRIYEKLFREEKGENFYPNFHDGLRELEKMKVGGREYLWWQSAKRICRNMVFSPAASKSLNARNPIRIETLLQKHIIIELDQEMPKPLRVFFAEVILRFIHLYRLSQGESDHKLRHCLFMEEIHNLTRKTRYDNDTPDSLENVFREIRSFGQGLVSITQHISLVPSYITGNTHTLILLAQQHQDDIEAARKAMFMPREDEIYFNSLRTGQGIVKIMEKINPCLVQFLYVPIEKGKITDEWLKINRRGYLSELSDGKSPEEGGYLRGEGIKDEKNKYPLSQSPAGRLLVDIFQHPLSSVTERYARLGFNSRHGNQYKKMLVLEKLIETRIITTSSGWISLFELTPKGRAFLRDLGYPAQDEKESIEHKFWKFRIAQFYRDKGFDVLVEQHINGKPDVIAFNKEKRIAIEIETGNSDALGNIEKNLKAGFDEILCVATSKDVEEKIKRDFRGNDKRVRIMNAVEFSFIGGKS